LVRSEADDTHLVINAVVDERERTARVTLYFKNFEYKLHLIENVL
jgi:hypothetical protein